MKKKKIVIFSIVIVILFLVISLFRNDNKTVLINEKKEDYLINSNTITMMYETETGSGEYQTTTDTSWPQEGYIFNETLSGCENGGTISWNDATQKVEMKTNISDKCYIYFDKYLSVQITNVTASNITSNSITVNVSATPGTNQIFKYYYSINNGSSYTESTNNIYTFTGLEKGTKYNIKVYAVDNEGHSSNIYSLSITTDNAVLLADYIIKEVYESDGVNGLYYHDGVGSYTNANLEAGDNGYRYSGVNPNNYVCFGSGAATCPDEYLYRIIGLFDDDKDNQYNVKLIKNTAYSESLPWNINGSNDWTTASLNTELNTVYFSSLGSEWNSKIIETTWYLGALSDSDRESNAKNIFNKERSGIGSGSNPTRYDAKIGLMYASDYEYSFLSSQWNQHVYIEDSWLDSSGSEWTITPSLDYSHMAIITGGMYSVDVDFLTTGPVFYLNSDVAYVSGDGTKNSPYIIS